MKNKLLKLLSLATTLSFLVIPGVSKAKLKTHDLNYYATQCKVITNIQLGLYDIYSKTEDETERKVLWETIKILQDVKKKDLERYWKLVKEMY